jgi:hypothetical protein
MAFLLRRKCGRSTTNGAGARGQAAARLKYAMTFLLEAE